MKKTKKDILSIYDLSSAEIWKIIQSAINLKKEKKSKFRLKGKSIGLIFEKPSTRTMVSFSAAMAQEDGTPLNLDINKLQTTRGESVYDTAKVLSRYLDAIVIRCFKHSYIEEFAKYSSVPVINALTDKEHPLQILADLMTIIEKYKIKNLKDLRKLKITFVGDANNVANSWLAVSAVLGLKFLLLGPKNFAPQKDLLNEALKVAKTTKADIKISNYVEDVKGSDVIYTDVWISMGEEKESVQRHKAFSKYQVNKKLLAKANTNCIVLHCLPAVRGEEISADVMAEQEVNIFNQAENRLHIHKAAMIYLIK